MLAILSNFSLNAQAALNRLTRRARKRRASRAFWQDTHTGSRLFDAALALIIGAILALAFLGGAA